MQSHLTLDRPPNRKKHLWGCLLVAALLLAVILLVIPAIQPGFWDGHFPLVLDVRSETGRKIEKIEFMCFYKRDMAEWIVEHPNVKADWLPKLTTKEADKYLAYVWCSGKFWPFDIETDYREPRYIILNVTFTDGDSTRKMAKIPPGRGRRSLEVPVP